MHTAPFIAVVLLAERSTGMTELAKNEGRRLASAGSIFALAGRRIDAADSSQKRFPFDRIGAVSEQLRSTFLSLKANAIVSSAANGADLVALRVASGLGMRCRIILPFSTRAFREISVIDRPGGELWGWVFDDLIALAQKRGDLVRLRGSLAQEAKAFSAANERIVSEAVRLSESLLSRSGAPPPKGAVAVAVWEGKPRDDGDATAQFAQLASAAGLPLICIPTLPL